MKKIIITATALCLLQAVSAGAVALRWDIPLNERLEIVRTARVRSLVNEKLQKTYEERNIIDLTCYERKENLSGVKGMFSVYQRGSEKEVFQLQKQYPSDFTIDRLGRYSVPKHLYVPNLRHIPTFPEADIAKGGKWAAEAELILDAFSKPFRLIFKTEYQLADIRKKEGGDIAVINFSFVINWNAAGGKYPADFPVRIAGKNAGTLYWDVMKNRPVSMSEKYRIVFCFPAGGKQINTNDFIMIFETTMKAYDPVTPEQRERARTELSREVPEGIAVDTEKRGLVLRLGDVLFDFDSSGLRNDSRDKLDKIAGALNRKYPDREIIVEGHTDNIGGGEYNMRLSKDRARSVAEYLRSGSRIDKLSYRGFGADRPIAGNDSREGRQKNRRVEIIIKLQ